MVKTGDSPLELTDFPDIDALGNGDSPDRVTRIAAARSATATVCRFVGDVERSTRSA